MIKFQNVSKRYPESPNKRMVIDDVSFEIQRGQKLGIVGINGAGKSTLIRLAAGVEKPTLGNITRTMTCSWPMGFGGAFQSSLSGNDNIRFLARIYGENYNKLRQQVETFSDLGEYLRAPVRTYSSGMRARFAFGLSLGIDFECLLIDEVIAVGDERFREKCHEAIMKRSHQALIFASHDTSLLNTYCDHFSIVIGGKYIKCEDLREAEQARAKALNIQ
jgi:capsular polysaccharide transport system ATP-binding protein